MIFGIHTRIGRLGLPAWIFGFLVLILGFAAPVRGFPNLYSAYTAVIGGQPTHMGLH
jgi:hypothetical protein